MAAPARSPSAKSVGAGGQRQIRDPQFAHRLNQALDANPLAPTRGRLSWLRDKLEQRFGVKARTGKPLSHEAVRRWIAGEVKPRPETLSMIAEILEVDEAWLSLGLTPDPISRSEARNVEVDGAVRLIAGLVQLKGGHVAFPDADDLRARRAHINLYAIIKGVHHEFHISLAQSVHGAAATFVLPLEIDAIRLGVIPTGDISYRVVQIGGDALRAGLRRGATVEVTLDGEQIRESEITSFANPL